MSSTNEQTITLITGANTGIGLALATLLLESPTATVLLGARSESKGLAAIDELKAKNLPGTADLVVIDVSSEESVEKAAKSVSEKYGHLDALVNNAAISGEDTSPFSRPAETPSSLSKQLLDAFTTNTVGPAITVAAFAPLLNASKQVPRVINVTSGAGSISMRLGDKGAHQAMKVVPYRVSKTALHMVTACQVYEYAEQGWKVFNFCPGFTASNLGPMNTVENGAKPTIEGARPMVAILKGERDAENGGYLNGTEKGSWAW